MERDKFVLNEILVDIFNDIMKIEESSLKNERLNDLSITEVHTIEQIGEDGQKSMSNVASSLNITVGTLTTAINNLVKKGYVERQRPKEDKRVVLLNLTKKGRLVYMIHERFHLKMISEIITGIDDKEREVLIRALEKLSIFFKEKYNLIEKELQNE